MSDTAPSPETAPDQGEQPPTAIEFKVEPFNHPMRSSEGHGLRVTVDGDTVAILLECTGDRWIIDSRYGYTLIHRWWHIDSVGAGVNIGDMPRIPFRRRADAIDAAYRVHLTHPDLRIDEYGLTAIERRMLNLEAGRIPGWERYPSGSHTYRLQAVLELFDGMRELRYGLILNKLIDKPGALRADPVTVNRLRRLRDTRRSARSARATTHLTSQITA